VDLGSVPPGSPGDARWQQLGAVLGTAFFRPGHPGATLYRMTATKLTPAVKELYCKELARTGLHLRSCEVIGISTQTISVHRRTDAQFDEACIQALQQHRELIEAEIKRRAIDGVEEPVYGKGNDSGVPIGHIRRYSDQLLALYAKRHIKEYRDSIKADQRVTGSLEVGLEVLRQLPEEAQEKLREVLVASAATRFTDGPTTPSN
jgi:hypothetical protein